MRTFEIFDFYYIAKISGPSGGGCQTAILLAEIFCGSFLHGLDLKKLIASENSKTT